MEFGLQVYSIVFIFIMAGVVLVPYFRGRSELFTFNNIFYVGSAIFVGLSGINAVIVGHYFQYDAETYLRFYLSTSLFYISYWFFYRKWNRAAGSGKGMGLQMPIWTPKGSILFCLSILPLLVLSVFVPNIPVIGRLADQIGFVVPGFIVASALWAWHRDKLNPFVISVSVVTAIVAISSLFSEGGGRRALYGAIFGVPITYYWLSMRFWRKSYVIMVMILVMFAGAAFDLAYNRVRWIGTTRSSQEIGGVDDRLRLLNENLSWKNFAGVSRMGQTGVEYSLMAIHFYSSSYRVFSVEPIHSIYVLLTFPIPRSIWRGKPEHLGLTLPFDARIFKDGTKTNAGPGIAGHLAQDGGMLLAVPYAMLFSLAIRFLDGLLIARGGDPLVLGFMSSSGFHILGWSRGDISSFTIWPILCFVFLWIVCKFSPLLGMARQPITAGAWEKLRARQK